MRYRPVWCCPGYAGPRRGPYTRRQRSSPSHSLPSALDPSALLSGQHYAIIKMRDAIIDASARLQAEGEERRALMCQIEALKDQQRSFVEVAVSGGAGMYCAQPRFFHRILSLSFAKNPDSLKSFLPCLDVWVAQLACRCPELGGGCGTLERTKTKHLGEFDSLGHFREGRTESVCALPVYLRKTGFPLSACTSAGSAVWVAVQGCVRTQACCGPKTAAHRYTRDMPIWSDWHACSVVFCGRARAHFTRLNVVLLA